MDMAGLLGAKPLVLVALGPPNGVVRLRSPNQRSIGSSSSHPIKEPPIKGGILLAGVAGL